MCLRILLFSAWATSVLACAVGSPLQAEELWTVLLDNGHVLRGEVVDEGNRLFVKLAPGSQVRLPKERIIVVGRSLDDVYRLQLDRIRGDNVDELLKLTRWCLRHELHGRAGELLLRLTAAAPKDARVQTLEQLMRTAITATRAPAESRETALDRTSLPDAAEIPPISREATAQFTQQIQPLLTNRCAASACHGTPGRSDLVLVRSLGGRWTQRLTQQNLHSTLEHVDWTSVEKSQLLLSATTAHGGRSLPILSSPRDDRSIELLRQWLASVTGSASPENSELLPEDSVGVTTPGDPTDSPQQPEVEAASAQLQSQPFDKPTAFVPRDPFDPDIFNRRFFPERFEDDKP